MAAILHTIHLIIGQAATLCHLYSARIVHGAEDLTELEFREEYL
jgi:hypothetical protein